MENSDKMWSTGEGKSKPLQHSCLENPMSSMKSQKVMTLKDKASRSQGVQYAIGEEGKSRGNEQAEPKPKQWPVVDVSGGEIKLQCCKEQYCIGIWNIRSMKQGKLEVLKQEMGRVNINILEISELKQTGMDEFNSDGHYIYYCGQESLRRNGAALRVNSRIQNTVLGCNLKNDRKISVVCFQGKLFNISHPSLCPNN